MNTKQIIEEAESNLIHTYNRYQIVLDKGDGVRLYDTDGKEYLDFGAGIAVFALGYNNKEYNDALKAQIDKLIHTSNYFYNEPAAKAAKGNKAYEKTIFLGFDGSTSACQAVLDGSLTLTCAQQPYDMGYKACETAVKAAKGESVDNVDTGTEIIEKDNAQARIDKMNEYLAKIK